jgi:putative tryptophan/tyrosine transport system substrate-binding protein
MRRRNLMTILAGAVAYPLFASAQQKTMPVIGFLSSRSAGESEPNLAAFHRGLSETGYVDGQNAAIEYRWAGGRYDQLPSLAADLVGRNVNVIVAAGGTPSARAAKNATSMIPIVFTAVADPVGTGLVASLARPGGNLTGVSTMSTELTPKLLELLSEVVPQIGLIALLVNPNVADAEPTIRDAQAAARTKALQLSIVRASTEGEIDGAFASLVQLHADALLIETDPFFFSRRDHIVALALRHAVPAIYEQREYAAAGGLISYGSSLADAYHQAGISAGKILNGAKPADLPVQQPTKFDLVVNLKTATALGLTIPPSILARADEVIE